MTYANNNNISLINSLNNASVTDFLTDILVFCLILFQLFCPPTNLHPQTNGSSWLSTIITYSNPQSQMVIVAQLKESSLINRIQQKKASFYNKLAFKQLKLSIYSIILFYQILYQLYKASNHCKYGKHKQEANYAKHDIRKLHNSCMGYLLAYFYCKGNH